MRSLNQFPKGLISLIGMQNQGENVRLMEEEVRLTVDVGANYELQVQESIFGSNVTGANGFNVFVASDLVVPAAELWHLLVFSISIVTAAGMTGRVGPSIRTAGPGSGPRFPLSNPISYVASETNWVTMSVPPFWMPAGYQLGFEMAQVAGGSPTVVSGQIIFARLRA